MTDKIKFLGQEIISEGCKMLPENLEAITNFKRPRNIKALQQFLVLINFCKNYNGNLSKDVIPLNNLLKKDTK